MSLPDPSSPFLNLRQIYDLAMEAEPKFLCLKIFWIKLTDFMDIVPRHPHLNRVQFEKRYIALSMPERLEFPLPLSSQGAKGQGSSLLVNGDLPNGQL